MSFSEQRQSPLSRIKQVSFFLAAAVVTLYFLPFLAVGQTPKTATPQLNTITPQTAPPSELSTAVIHPEAESSAPVLNTPIFFLNAAEKGIFFRLSFNEELAGNPSGGIRQGFTGSQYMTFGSDLDLHKLVAWRGGTFHAIVIAENSNPLSENYIGGGIDVQENAAPFNLVRFLNFTLEQKASLRLHDDLHLIAGRIAVTPYFMQSVLTCLFMNHSFCGVMYGFTQSTGAAVAPLASWGGIGKINTTANSYFQFGGFAVDGNTLKASTDIFHWGTSGVTGVDYLAEIGHETHFSTERLPHYYRIGVSYLDAPRDDVLLNTNGLPFYQFGGTKLTHRGETALYVAAGQAISRPDPDSHRNLALFASMYLNFANSEAIKYSIRFGIVKAGTFGSRGHDTVGLGFSPTTFTSKEVAYLTGMRIEAGGKGRVPSSEWNLELNYGYEVAPGIVLRPNIQYVIHPDSRYTPSYPSDIPNAFVIGLQINANIGTLFNLPQVR
jgi:porin